MAGKIIDDGLQDEGPIAAINVTSFIDIMFCLLIMFMVAAPLLGPQSEVKLELPKAKANAIEKEQFEQSVISIDAKGQVFIGSTPLSADIAQMSNQLANNAKIKESNFVFIQGDETVPYERIVDVLIALKDAEVGQVGFVTNPNFKNE